MLHGRKYRYRCDTDVQESNMNTHFVLIIVMFENLHEITTSYATYRHYFKADER